MLRALIAALLVANLAFFAWSHGWLDEFVGLRSIGDREPERLLRQVRPETIRILPAGTGDVVAAPVLGCHEAGPFDDTEIAAAESAAQTRLPAGSWVTVQTEQPAVWIVYMGRYAARDAMARKEDELRRRKLPFEEIAEPPALAPGLALGRFDARAAATQALDQFTAQGVRTARVVELAPASKRHTLRVEKAEPSLSAQLQALPAEAFGKRFTPCVKAAGSG